MALGGSPRVPGVYSWDISRSARTREEYPANLEITILERIGSKRLDIQRCQATLEKTVNIARSQYCTESRKGGGKWKKRDRSVKSAKGKEMYPFRKQKVPPRYP